MSTNKFTPMCIVVRFCVQILNFFFQPYIRILYIYFTIHVSCLTTTTVILISLICKLAKRIIHYDIWNTYKARCFFSRKAVERLSYRCTCSMLPVLLESKYLIYICYFVCIILVILCSLLCFSVFHDWSLFLDYILFFYFR